MVSPRRLDAESSGDEMESPVVKLRCRCRDRPRGSVVPMPVRLAGVDHCLEVVIGVVDVVIAAGVVAALEGQLCRGRM